MATSWAKITDLAEHRQLSRLILCCTLHPHRHITWHTVESFIYILCPVFNSWSITEGNAVMKWAEVKRILLCFEIIWKVLLNIEWVFHAVSASFDYVHPAPWDAHEQAHIVLKPHFDICEEIQGCNYNAKSWKREKLTCGIDSEVAMKCAMSNGIALLSYHQRWQWRVSLKGEPK